MLEGFNPIDVGQKILSTGSRMAESAKSFVPVLANEVSKDARDIVRASRFISPYGSAAKAVTNKVVDDKIFKPIGVSESDIHDMDPRNHSVGENAAALANAMFTVGTTALGGSALKGAVKGGKVLYNGAKSAVKTTKGIKEVAGGLKDALKAMKPSNFSKVSTPVRETITTTLNKPSKLSGTMKNGQWIPDMEKQTVNLLKTTGYKKVIKNNALEFAGERMNSGAKLIRNARRSAPSVREALRAGRDVAKIGPASLPGVEPAYDEYKRQRRRK